MTVKADLPTVIIAAYNEASVIDETLRTLVNESNGFQILVVCNGCTDNTESKIKENFKSVLCYSIDTASKALAIRHAESLQPGFPRLYLDADILLRGKDATYLLGVSKRCHSPSLLIPSSQVNFENCSMWVKKFYRAWYHSPYVKGQGYGAGAYILNQSARSHFEQWPDLIADDAFVRSRIDVSNTQIDHLHQVQVKAPKTLWSLIKVKTRSKLGNFQLRKFNQKHGFNSPKIKSTVTPDKKRLNMSDKFIYFTVNSIAYTLAKFKSTIGNEKWLRDESNR